MASFARTMRLGAGAVGLGYGLYRLARGRNDWMTTTFLTAGFSVAINALTGRRVQIDPVGSLANAVTSTMSRTAVNALRRTAADAVVNAGWMP